MYRAVDNIKALESKLPVYFLNQVDSYESQFVKLAMQIHNYLVIESLPRDALGRRADPEAAEIAFWIEFDALHKQLYDYISKTIDDEVKQYQDEINTLRQEVNNLKQQLAANKVASTKPERTQPVKINKNKPIQLFKAAKLLNISCAKLRDTLIELEHPKYGNFQKIPDFEMVEHVAEYLGIEVNV